MPLVRRVQVRLLGAEGAVVVVTGLVALAGATAAGAWILGAPVGGASAGLALFVAIVAAGLRRAWLTWTPQAVADAIEARVPGLHNLVLTAVELETSPDRASRYMRDQVARQAADRVAGVRPGVVAPLGRPLVRLAAVAAGAGAVIVAALGSVGSDVPRAARVPVASARITRVHVVITPPGYLNGNAQAYDDPDEVRLTAGSAMRLEVAATTRLAWVEDGIAGPRPFRREASGAFALEWVPGRTSTLVVAAGDSTGVPGDTRILPVTVIPDDAPVVRVVTPGRDLAFATPERLVDLHIEAEDAGGLRELELRFTRLSGSGETVTFVEGQVPLHVERTSDRYWRGRATWRLEMLGLEDGDALVYRAVARDARPDSDWASSELYTIEIGRRLEFASAGSGLPGDDRRYALSQQMVIMKTEQLQAERSRRRADAWAEQTTLLAMEQRMVRAEVVFLSGGDVQDEVEEAAHADELQEGRLENRGRAEMLRAINQMSRAEARLTAGDTAGALIFERAALEALQRAFDRRRYFLRTVPERSRIDPSRRLSGDRRQAESFARPGASHAGDPLAAERALLVDLTAVADSGAPVAPALIARLASLDARSSAWREAAAALASAESSDARRAAATTAVHLVSARARAALAPSVNGPLSVAPGALRGWWAEESRVRRSP